MVNVVCYGGKGGVGKTTLAAATGLEAARRERRTLVISTDPAHSLADLFGVVPQSGRTAVSVADGDTDLWIEELSPTAGTDTYRTIVESLTAELRTAGIHLEKSAVERLFTAGVIPGSDELAAIEALATYSDDGESEFDQIIVDTAPTGHTLRLLELPEVLQETVAAASSVRGQLRRRVDTARSAVFGPMAFFGTRSEETDEFAELADRMESVRTLLTDSSRTSFRVVCLPEPLAVAETGRLIEQLRAFEIPVTTLCINRVLTDASPECERCQTTQRAHRHQVDVLEADYPDLEVVSLPAVFNAATSHELVEQLTTAVPPASTHDQPPRS